MAIMLVCETLDQMRLMIIFAGKKVLALYQLGAI